MDNNYDIALINGEVVTTTEVFPADIYIKGGKIVEIATRSSFREHSCNKIIDVKGRHILAGAIDTHCHFRDPGATHKEDFATGTRAAIAGGVTTVFDMPNTNPSVLDPAGLAVKVANFSNKAYADYGIWGLSLGQLNLKELPKLAEAGISAIKFFWGYAINRQNKALIYNYVPGTTDVIPPLDDGEVYEIFEQMATTGKVLAIHAENCELMNLLGKRLKSSGKHDYNSFVASRPALAEQLTIQTAAAMAEATGARLHILHVTSRAGVQAIREAKARGVNITGETCPQYLFLSSNNYAKIGPMMKVYPLIKHEEDRLALWDGLFDGTLDFVASDHAPHVVAEKQGPLDTIPAGMCGVETLLPLMLNEVNRGKFTLPFMTRILSKNVADIYGLSNKGSIAVGKDADLVVVDMNKTDLIKNERLHSKQPLTAFHNWPVKGWPVKVLLRGQVVMDEGQIIPTEACGQWLGNNN